MKEEDFVPNLSQWVICQDIFLDYVKENSPINLTPSGNPKGTVLLAINELMQTYKADNTQLSTRSKYYNFHIVYLFFELSLLNNLLEHKENKKGVVEIVLNDTQFDNYKKLNPIEKYFSYFTTFWCLYYPNQEFSFSSYNTFNSINSFVSLFANSNPKTKLEIENRRITYKKENFGFYYPHYWLFFQYLGFFDIEIDRIKILKQNDNLCDLFSSLTITSVGVELSKILITECRQGKWNKMAYYECGYGGDFNVDNEEEEDNEFVEKNLEDFIVPFQTLFPKLQTIITPLPIEKMTDTNTNFYFKVSLEASIYRIIAINGTNTFEDLHLAIQKAYKFDDDHLYFFAMDRKGYQSKNKIICSNSDPDIFDIFAAETKLLDYGWKAKNKFDYTFDFGDNWEFDCVLMELKTDEKPLKKFKIIESVGKAPEQYPDWED